MILVKASMSGDWCPSSCRSVVHIRRRCFDVSGYYGLLGVDGGATEQEIKKAAKDRMLHLHPDVGGDEGEFRKVLEAYKVLSDPKKRAVYDISSEGQHISVANRAEGIASAPLGACFYKGIADILYGQDLELVYAWQKMVLDAAYLFGAVFVVKVGISYQIEDYGLIDDVAMISPKTKLDKAMAEAYVLHEMTKGETKC